MMATETGRSPAEAGSGHSAEPEPCSTVSAVPASVPNAAAFDPGPLKIMGRQTKTQIGGFYVVGPDRMGHATAYVSGRANASLYATAPELYQMLTIAVGILNAAGIMWLGGDKADAVLAKARGDA